MRINLIIIIYNITILTLFNNTLSYHYPLLTMQTNRKVVKTTVVRRPRPNRRLFSTYRPRFVRPRVIVNSTILQRRRRLNQSRRDRLRNKTRNPNRRNNNNPKMTGMPPAVRDYMHCRLDPFSTSGILGIPDNSNQPRVVVDHRLICNFVAGTSGGFRIAVMPWLPHPLLIQPLDMNDSTWLFDGVHPTANNSALNFSNYFCNPTFIEWSGQRVFRNSSPNDLDTVDIPYEARRMRFVTIGAKIVYTGSTMTNAGSILVNDGSFSVQPQETNASLFSIYTAATSGVITYSADEINQTTLNFTPNYAVRSNSSLNCPLKIGAYTILKNQQSDHPWKNISPALNFMSTPSTSDGCIMIAPSSDPLASGFTRDYPCVQAYDDSICPKLFTIQNLSAGSSFQIELVYCVEYAIDPNSNIVSLAKQPPSFPEAVMKADAVVNSQPKNIPLGNEIISTIGTTVSDTITGVAQAFSPFKSMTFTNSKLHT